MTDPRNPLITGVTNDAGYRGDDKLPTSYAVNQLFSGETIDVDINADTLMNCGNYRFNSTTTGLPTHMIGNTGILTVMHDRPAAGESVTVVRQVAWPDNKNDVTPYTRTYQGSSWGDWQTMGGNELRRVELTNSQTADINTAYYSFGNYVLTLPNPSNLKIGARVVLEQWSGNGSVSYSDNTDSYSQATEAVYASNASRTFLGPQIYQFEVVDSGNSSKIWVMDVENDLSNLATKITNHANAANPHPQYLLESRYVAERYGGDIEDTFLLKSTFESHIDPEIEPDPHTQYLLRSEAPWENSLGSTYPDGTICSANGKTVGELINNKEPRSLVYKINGNVNPDSTFKDANNDPYEFASLLQRIHLVFIIPAGTSYTITLPSASNYGSIKHMAKLTIELLPSTSPNNSSVTIQTANVISGGAPAMSEVFVNTSNTSRLILPFETSIDSNESQSWTLITI